MFSLKRSIRGLGPTFACLAALAVPAMADDDMPAPFYIIKHADNPDSLQAMASTPLEEGRSHSIRIMFQARNIHISDFYQAPTWAQVDETTFQGWVGTNCGGGPAKFVWRGCYHPKPNSDPVPLFEPYIEVDLGTVDSAAWTISASSYPSSKGSTWNTEVTQGPVLKNYEQFVTLTVAAVEDSCRGQTPHTITVKIRGDDPLRDLDSETFTIKKKDNDLLAASC